MANCESRFTSMVYVSLGVNVVLSLAVIAINAVILYLLHIRMLATSAIDDSSARFQEAIKAADFARMPIVGVILLAELVDIKYAEIVKEYEKDSMERRTIVYDIFGQNSTIRKFVDHHPSLFLRNGYDGESLLLAQSGAKTKSLMPKNPEANKQEPKPDATKTAVNKLEPNKTALGPTPTQTLPSTAATDLQTLPDDPLRKV